MADGVDLSGAAFNDLRAAMQDSLSKTLPTDPSPQGPSNFANVADTVLHAPLDLATGIGDAIAHGASTLGAAGEEFLSHPINGSIAASQQLAQGVEKVGIGGRLTFRQASDALGFTSPEETQRLTQMMNTRAQQADAASAQLGVPNIGAAAKFVGENAALGAALGPLAASGKGSLGLAEGLTGVVGNGAIGQGATAAALGGAAGGLQYDPNATLASKAGDIAGNAITGAALGVGVPAAAQGISKGLGFAAEHLSGSIDPAKVAAFKQLGVPYLASNVQSNPIVQHTYEKVETTLNSIPAFALEGKIAKQSLQFQKAGYKIIQELDNKLEMNDPSPLYKQITDSEKGGNLYMHNVDKISNAAAAVLDELTSGRFGTQMSPDSLSLIEQSMDLPNSNFIQIQKARAAISSQIGNLALNPTNTSGEEISQLMNIKNAMTDTLKDISEKAGFPGVFAQADQMYKDNLAMDLFKKGWSRGFVGNRAGNPELINPADAKMRMTALDMGFNKATMALKDANLTLPANFDSAFSALKTVGNALTKQAAQPKKPGISLSLAGEAGGQAAALGGLAHFVGMPAVPVSLALTKGASMLMYTPTGINLLDKLGQKISSMQTPAEALKTPIGRLVGSLAIGLAQVDQMKAPEHADQPYPSTLAPDLSGQSPQQLEQTLRDAIQKGMK